MRSNQNTMYKGRFPAVVFIVMVVVARYTVVGEIQKQRENHDKLLDTEGSRTTLLDVSNVFADKEHNAIMTLTRSRRNYDDRTTGKRSLAIVFDVSTSMKDDLDQLKSVATEVVNEAPALIDNYILVPFEDPRIGPRLVTRNKNDFIRALKKLTTGGGGDCPELAVGGILQALEVASPYSTIYVFTDADAKDTELYPSVRRLVEEKHTPIVMFRTGNCGASYFPKRKVLDDIAAVIETTKEQLGQAFLSNTRSMLQKPPEVSLNMNKVELLEGAVLKLNCQAKSESRMVVQWKRLEQLLVEQKFNSTDTLLLKIENVTKEHSNTYVCIAHNSAGDQQQTVEVNVKKPVISVSPKDIVIIEHTESVSIQCTTQNVKPEVSKVWTYNGAQIESARDHEYLQLYNLTSMDEGTYECRVEINGRFISDSTNLTVESAPKILLNVNETKMSPYGKPLTLDCGIVGKPKPQISWSYRSLGSSREKALTNNETSLRLPTVTPEAEGFYTCEGSNSRGKAQRSILLLGEANGPPQINKSLKKTIYVPNGGTAVLHCSCSFCRPLTNYIWTNGHMKFENSSFEVQNNARVNLILDQTRNAIQYNLTIDDFSSANEGNYSCILSNAHGSDSFALQVLLLMEPIVNAISVDDKPQKEEVFGLINFVHNLTCNAVGVPEPQITWLFNGNAVDNSSRYDLQNDNKTLTLVDGFDLGYSGVYKCIASNLYGRAEAKLLLKYMFLQLFLIFVIILILLYCCLSRIKKCMQSPGSQEKPDVNPKSERSNVIDSTTNKDKLQLVG